MLQGFQRNFKNAFTSHAELNVHRHPIGPRAGKWGCGEREWGDWFQLFRNMSGAVRHLCADFLSLKRKFSLAANGDCDLILKVVCTTCGGTAHDHELIPHRENRGPVGDLYQMLLTCLTSLVFLFTSKMFSQIFLPLTCGVLQSSLSDISHSLPVLESWMSEWVKVKNLYRTSWVQEMLSAMWWWAKMIRFVSVHRKLDSLNSFGTQIPTSVDVKRKQRDELFTNARISNFTSYMKTNLFYAIFWQKSG